MSIFRKVSMHDIEKYVEVPDGVKGMQCQLNVNGPQFYEAKAKNSGPKAKSRFDTVSMKGGNK